MTKEYQKRGPFAVDQIEFRERIVIRTDSAGQPDSRPGFKIVSGIQHGVAGSHRLKRSDDSSGGEFGSRSNMSMRSNAGIFSNGTGTFDRREWVNDRIGFDLCAGVDDRERRNGNRHSLGH